ncbi:MAG: chloroperoxidase [Planctomycetota bacterium]
MRLSRSFVIHLSCVLVLSSLSMAREIAGDPPGRDSILDWNLITLNTVALDSAGVYGTADERGPTRTSRALAIIHAAMFDAANSVDTQASSYLVKIPVTSASLDAAVATAASRTLTSLYPKQASRIKNLYNDYLTPLTDSGRRARGVMVGNMVADMMLLARYSDGSQTVGSYKPTGLAGDHNVDPLNRTQGFLDPTWGQVRTFALNNSFSYVPPPCPPLGSSEYAQAFADVKSLGGDGVITPTTRTAEQTEIGIYWAYDGSPGIGTPPRMYNQIVRTIAQQEMNTEAENARLFALVNLAQADAGIVAWKMKYNQRLWRPVLGIRGAGNDGNAATSPDTNWTPLGSPFSNCTNVCQNFTPPFPSYCSGHAAFGGAVFSVLEAFYGTDIVPFTFVSDELNGVTTDSHGVVRPYKPRTFISLRDAAVENARSRIFLGIHWKFDSDEGLRTGYAIGNFVTSRLLKKMSVDPGIPGI